MCWGGRHQGPVLFVRSAASTDELELTGFSKMHSNYDMAIYRLFGCFLIPLILTMKSNQQQSNKKRGIIWDWIQQNKRETMIFCICVGIGLIDLLNSLLGPCAPSLAQQVTEASASVSPFFPNSARQVVISTLDFFFTDWELALSANMSGAFASPSQTHTGSCWMSCYIGTVVGHAFSSSWISNSLQWGRPWWRVPL